MTFGYEVMAAVMAAILDFASMATLISSDGERSEKIQP